MLRLLVSLAEPKSEAGVGGGSQAFGVNSLGIYSYTRRQERTPSALPAFPRRDCWNKPYKGWLCSQFKFP